MDMNVYFPPMHVMERSIWPGWPIGNLHDKSLFQQMERDMGMEIERMEKIFRGVAQLSSQTWSPGNLRVALQQPTVSAAFHIEAPRKQGDEFVVSLNIQGYSPKDLAVKVSGDKLVVAGRREVKSGDSGAYSHSYQEFHEAMQLPKDVDPETVSCCLTDDGKLKIKAQRRALPVTAGRMVAIE